jgi:sterol desaturase/sphingolipid hydroxylase (fatty acid hydroxylase superfamily)
MRSLISEADVARRRLDPAPNSLDVASASRHILPPLTYVNVRYRNVMIILIVLACAVVMVAIECVGRGRRWPSVRGWRWRALTVNAAQAGFVFLGGVLCDPWLSAHRPWSSDALGTADSAIVGYVVLTFLYYWWHRCRHDVPLLWRWLHQFHHSPQRIEIITSFYKHPFELASNSVLSSTIVYGVAGCGPEAATVAVLIAGLAELFYHWNVRTPRWLGYLVQRPEMHCVHHQDGAHRCNYGDLPIWDICFGTFANPPTFSGRCGFGEREREFGAMLIGRSVDAPTPALGLAA